MVFGLAGPVTDQTEGSVARSNLMWVISGPGADLAALPKDKHVLLKCTLDGGGLLKDHVYQTSADATQLLDITVVASHSHSSNSTGGNLVSIYQANSKMIELALTKILDLKKAQWIETATSGGTAEDNTDGTTGERSIRLRTNVTLGGAYMITYPHLKIDFSKRALFQFKARIETMTNLALHSGVNADNVTVADTNTQKFDAEICTTTNNNWHLRTASGSNKTMSDSGIAATTNRVGIKIEHLPDISPPETDMYVDASAVFRKTSDIPVSGASADNNLIHHSIKNSIAGDRPYHIYGSRLVYYVSDNWV